MKLKKRISYAPVLLLLLSLCMLLVSCSAANDLPAGNESKTEISSNASLGFSNSEPNVNTPADTERKIIKTFEILTETLTFDDAIASLNALITEYGGYVECASSVDKSLNNSSTSYSRYASYTIRIPAEQADAFVHSVGTLLNITSNRSYVEDISETYYSIEARLEELEAERDSLLDILDAPETKTDYDLWLTVKQRLSEVTQQIAVYQGQIKRYDSQVAYSTVNLGIQEVLHYQAVSKNNSFGSRLGAAFRDGWGGFVRGLQNFVIWLAEALPTLCLLTLITVGIVLFVRSRLRRKARKKGLFEEKPKS